MSVSLVLAWLSTEKLTEGLWSHAQSCSSCSRPLCVWFLSLACCFKAAFSCHRVNFLSLIVFFWMSPHSLGRPISCHHRLAMARTWGRPCKWSLLCLRPCIQFFLSCVKALFSLLHLPIWFNSSIFQEAENTPRVAFCAEMGPGPDFWSPWKSMYVVYKRWYFFLFIPDNVNSIWKAKIFGNIICCILPYKGLKPL